METPDQKFYRANGKSPKEDAQAGARVVGVFLILAGLITLTGVYLLTDHLW